MRFGLLILLLIATLFGSGFWYTHIDTACNIPIRYSIGEIDPRFGTSEEEVRRIAGRAELLWESAVNKELFIYDVDAKLKISFIFDERQENAEIEAELREDLEVTEGMSESVTAQYEALIREFRSLRNQYETRVVAYEASLRTYNDEVSVWNRSGGISDATLESLRATESTLKNEQGELEKLSKRLNTIVTELNRIGARGNTLIGNYNSIVEEYNRRFNEISDFTQGEFTPQGITIYQFDSEDDLVIVLAHEFGHALALDHVDNEQSIMYRVMDSQDVALGVTEEDIAELRRVCDEVSPIVKLLRFLRSFV